MLARIYQPAKNAMQSGRRNAKGWVLDFDAAEARKVDPLMGWTGSSDMLDQVTLTFESKAAAEAYAKKHGLAYKVEEPQQRKPKIKSYAENFSADRRFTWTH